MIHLFWLGFALAASPGPDFFLILGHTLSYGRLIGYVTLLGNRVSLCTHILIAILGLSIVLQRSVTLFLVVRFLGAAYLVYLGGRNLYVRYHGDKTAAVGSTSGSLSLTAAFRRGFLNNLLNPKVSLFFLSLFPQFTSRDMLAESPWSVATIFFLGNTSWWVPLILVVGVARLRALLFRVQFALDVLFGVVFIGFGFRVFWEEIVG